MKRKKKKTKMLSQVDLIKIWDLWNFLLKYKRILKIFC